MAAHPYEALPPAAFWRTGVAGADPTFLSGLWTPRFRIGRDDRIGTAGSCFAQHVGAALIAAGYSVPIIEHPLPEMEPATQARFGFGLYPARYGNIYTARQLRQLIEDCLQTRIHPEAVWERDGRFFDALRPSVEPFGLPSADDVIRSRQLHLQRVCDMMHNIDVLIFTLGLTETWEEVATGLVYPTCPGVIAGTFDDRRHAFRNLSFGEVVEDMQMVINHLRAMSPGVRFLLTVSPVPLTATAAGGHVLSASTASKALLRAAAAEIVARNDCADYFPSYEIITNPAARGRFFAPNLRSVTAEGVDVVMRHFLAAQRAGRQVPPPAPVADTLAGAEEAQAEAVCEEILLDSFARGRPDG